MNFDEWWQQNRSSIRPAKAEDACRSVWDAAVAAERERCAEIARNGCLVPPDGGSPAEEEAALCDEIARRIREA